MSASDTSATPAALETFAKKVSVPDRLVLSPCTGDVKRARKWLSDFAGGATDGVVAKRLDGPYESGVRAMVKVKRLRTADCVVGGFRYEEGGREVGSLLLGLYDEQGKLDHLGFTSTIKDAERAKFEEGHIPGAQFVDLQADLSDHDSHLNFTAPRAEDFARRLVHPERGAMTLDVEAARRAIAQRVAGPLSLDVEHAADGLLAVTNTNLAAAIRLSLFEKGLDPRDFTLLSFGGGGGKSGGVPEKLSGARSIAVG